MLSRFGRGAVVGTGLALLVTSCTSPHYKGICEGRKVEITVYDKDEGGRIVDYEVSIQLLDGKEVGGESTAGGPCTMEATDSLNNLVRDPVQIWQKCGRHRATFCFNKGEAVLYKNDSVLLDPAKARDNKDCPANPYELFALVEATVASCADMAK